MIARLSDVNAEESSVINVNVNSQSRLQIMKVKKLSHCLHLREPINCFTDFKPSNLAYVQSSEYPTRI